MVVGSGDDDDDNGDDDNNNSKIIINIMTSCVVSFVFPFRRISKKDGLFQIQSQCVR